MLPMNLKLAQAELEVKANQADEFFKSLETAGKATSDQAAEYKNRMAEVNELTAHVKFLSDREEAKNATPAHVPAPEVKTNKVISLAEQYKELNGGFEFKAGNRLELSMDAKAFQKGEFKAFGASDNAQIFSNAEIVGAAVRPARVLDYFRMVPTDQTAVNWRYQTLTDATGSRSEKAALQESTWTLTAVSAPVSAIGTYVDLTEEEIADDAGMYDLINVQLPQMVRAKMDRDATVGSGTAPEMLGLYNATGYQTQAKGGDSRVLAIKKALTKVQVTGLASPSLIVLHPNDWDDIISDLLTASTGNAVINYQAGLNPRLWGLPVVLAETLTEGNGMVIDMDYFPLRMRNQLLIEQTNADGNKFQDLTRTIRAYVRAVMQYRRGAAVCRVTGI